jgi:hypothetical protein
MATINASNIKTIRADLEAALAAVAKKHGIQFTMGRITYSDAKLSGKLTAVDTSATVNGAAVVAATPEAVDLARYGKSYIGDPSFDFGATYMDGQIGKFTIVGLKTRSHKYPFVIKAVSDGKTYKASATHLKFARKVAA